MAMASFLPPFSLDLSDVVDEAFIAPPANVLESKEILEEAEKQILYRDFAKVGITPDTYLSLDDLLTRLRRSPRNYDEEMVRRIFAALSSYSVTGTNYVAGRTFIESYMKRRRELAAVLDTAHAEVEATERMLQQAEANLHNIGRSSSAMLGEESKLTVQIVSLQRAAEESACTDTGPAQLYKVHLECQQQVIETQPAPMRQNCCYFNEMFSFEILKREGGLRLCVLRVDTQGGGVEELVGDCVILLDQLADQKKHEMTKEVWGAQKSEIVLSCQWIYSKKLLYETYLSEFSMRRDAKLREISDYQIELDKLNAPFQESEPQGYTGGLLGAYNLGADYLSKLLDQLRVYLQLGGWLPTSHHMTAITFWLACVAGYTRAVCLDQMIAAFVFWNNIDPRRWTVDRYSFLMLCSACGIGLDVSWIRTYFSAWNNGSVESDMHNITKIFSIFLCVWKVMLYLLFWKCRHDLKKKIAHDSQLSTASGAYVSLKMEEPLTTGLQQPTADSLRPLPLPGT